MIAAAKQIIAVRHRRKRAVERNDFEIVFRQFEIADDFGTEQADDIGADRIFKTRIDLFSDRRAAEHMAALQDEHFFPGFGEIGCAGQAVVAGADDDRIIVGHGGDLLKRAYLVISSAKSTRPAGLSMSILRLNPKSTLQMPIGTPFHSRTSALCASQNWRTWSGYFVASSYDVMHDYEYHAIRNSAALIDISPLYKYDVRGKDALQIGQPRPHARRGKMRGRAGALRLSLRRRRRSDSRRNGFSVSAKDHFRFHLADPSLRWLNSTRSVWMLSIKEVSEEIAALAFQGPNALKILQQIVDRRVGQL